MKIVQSIPVGTEEIIQTATFWESPGIVEFDPEKFTEISAIYFVCSGYVSRNTYKMEIELYNKTDGTSIVINEYSTTSPVMVVSADIKNLLIVKKDLTIRIKQDQTGGANVGTVKGGYLLVCQNITGTNRKSVTYYQGSPKSFWMVGSSWYNENSYGFYPKIEECDGGIKAYIEGNTAAVGANATQVRLYDITADAPVANSTVSITSAFVVHFSSPNLTLIASHEYKIQSKNPSFFGSFNTYNSILRIEQNDFSQIVSVPVNLWDIEYITISGWTDYWPVFRLLIENIEGLDYEEFDLDYKISGYASPAVDANTRFYDKTGSAVISGTEHTHHIDGSYSVIENDTPNLPNVNSNIAFQSDNDKIYYITNGYLQAKLHEAIPWPPSIRPDKYQPSGYHCFVKQYVENKVRNLRPFKLPDLTFW